MAAAQLSFQFYEKSCPLVLSIINLEVQDAVSNEAHTGPFLLRLHFHDCFGRVITFSLYIFMPLLVFFFTLLNYYYYIFWHLSH